MLRTRLAILGSVSAITLLAATASQALQPPTMNLGTLRPVDQWKVGTVDAKGLSYCAMVNKFDKQAVLAFARSPGGYSSVAVDFRESFFSPGAQYSVTLTPESGRTRHLGARASSDRSIVVQIGQDDPLFKELASDGDLEVGLPTIDVTFSLRKFSGSYGDLVDCAGQLKPPVSASTAPVERVERDALASEVESISSGTTPGQKTKAAEFSRMEAELDRAAAAEADGTAADSRKLLASSGSGPATVAPVQEAEMPNRQIDAQQAARAAEARKAAEVLKAAAEAKRKEIAAAEAAKQSAAETRVADYARKDESLKAELAATARRRDDVAAQESSDDSKALKAQLISLQGQVAGLKQQRSAQESDLTKQLAETQGAFEGRIAALQAERDRLRQDLAAAVAASAAQKKDFEGRLAAAESAQKTSAEQSAGVIARLSRAEEQRQDSEARLAAMGKQNKLLQAALDAQKAQIAAASGSTHATESRVAALAAERDRETALLRQKLDEANALYTRQTQQLDTARSRLAQLEGRKKEPADNDAVGAVALMPSERAELEEYRRQTGQSGHATQQAAAEPPPPAPPGGNAAPQPRKILASLSPAPKAEALPVQPVISENLLANAAKPESRKSSAAEAAAVEPAADARADIPAPEKQDGITWDIVGYRKPQPEAPPSPRAEAAPVAPAVPVADAFVPAASRTGRPNKAEAFLDRIMAYHRPGAEPQPGPLPEEQVAGLSEDDKAAPPAPKTAVPIRTATKAGKDENEAPPQVASKKAPVGSAALAAVEPATGGNDATVPAPKAPPVVAAGPVTLDRLLSSAGLRRVAYMPVTPQADETVKQWTAGRLTGMIEQQRADGAFGAAVQAYLDRYRADCKSGLNVSAAPARETSAGTLATATASCADAGNGYASSFVFLQSGATFSAILHTGVPADAAEVRKTGDAVAEALRSSGGLAAAEALPLPAPERKLALPALTVQEATQKVSVSYAAPDADIQTVFVQ